MKVYLAGGLGFIGHTVAGILSKEGNDVVILDSYEDYGVLDHAELNAVYAERANFHVNHSKIVKADISKPLDITDADAIVHLASFPRAKAVDLNPARASESMHVGTIRLCEAAVKNSAKMIFISSSMVYGDWIGHEAVETQELNPKGLYGLMKVQGEQLTRTICADNHVIIRPSAVYGPRDVTDRVVSLMFKAAMAGEPIKIEGENNILDFTYVTDIAYGIVNAIYSKNTNVTVNMSLSIGYALGDLAYAIKDITASESPLLVHDHNPRYPKRGVQNIELAHKLFDFNPNIDLYSGLSQYFSWLQYSKSSGYRMQYANKNFLSD